MGSLHEKIVANLRRSLATPIEEPRDLSGIIKDFEMTFESSWKLLAQRLLDQGHETQGARDVYSKAYQLGLIADETQWLAMIQDRNRSAHVYDEKDAREIADRVKAVYLPLFQSLV